MIQPPSWDGMERALDNTERAFATTRRFMNPMIYRIMLIIKTWWATLLVILGLALVVFGAGDLVDSLHSHCSASGASQYCPGANTAEQRHARTAALELLGIGVLVVLLGCVLYLRWFRPSYWRAKVYQAVELPMERAVDHAMDRAIDGAWNQVADRRRRDR